MPDYTNSQLYFYKANPIYQLYAIKSKKGLGIHNTSDHTLLADIFIKDFNFVVEYIWDLITGKFLTVIFKDGSIRVYDIFKSGRLVSFFRSPIKPSCAYWDRLIKEKSLEHELKVFDYDISHSMPTLVKFMSDARGLLLVPFVQNTQAWRHIDFDVNSKLENQLSEISAEDILDAHILYTGQNREQFTILLNGVYDLSDAHVPDPISESLLKIIKLRNGEYIAFYENGYLRKLDITALSNNDVKLSLLNSSIEVRNLIILLRDQVEIIKKELLNPYESFMNLICVEAFSGYPRLYELLTELLMTGDIEEDFEDWLVNTIGERNLRKWKGLGSELFDKLIQIFSIIFIPTLEKFIVMSERIQSYLKAIDYMEKGTVSNNYVEINNLIDSLSNMLELTLQKIPKINNFKMVFEIFIDWIRNTVYVITDDNYKSKFSLASCNSYASDIQKFINLQFKELCKPIYDIVPELEMYLKDISTSVDSIDKDLIKVHLNRSIKLDLISKILIELTNSSDEHITTRMLDIQNIESKRCCMYFIQEKQTDDSGNDINVHNYKIGLLSTDNMNIIHPGKTIAIAEKYQNLIFEDVRIVEHVHEEANFESYKTSSDLLRDQLRINRENQCKSTGKKVFQHSNNAVIDNSNLNKHLKLQLILKFKDSDDIQRPNYIYGKINLEIDQQYNIREVQNTAQQKADTSYSFEVTFQN